MKYTKIISLVLVVAMLSLSGVTAFAAPTVTAVHDVSGTTINISGKTEDINEAGVTLVLLAPNLTDVVDNPETTDVNEREVAIKAVVDTMVTSGTWDDEVVASVSQVFAAADGTYTGSFTLAADAPSGDYIVYATSNDVASYELYFSTPANKKSALAEILVAINDPAFDVESTKAAAISTVKGLIETHARELAFDLTLVKNEDGSYITQKDAVLLDAAEALFTNDTLLALPQAAGSIQDADLLTARKEIEVEIVNALFNANIPSDITDYTGKFLNTTSATLTAYGELTDNAKAYARSMIFGANFANADDMEAMLSDAVKIALIVIDGTKDFTKTASTAADLGLEKASAFAGLTDTQKVNVISNVRTSAPKTVSDLDTYFTNAVNSYSNGTPAPDVDTGEEVSPGLTITTGGGNGGGGDDKPATVVYTDLGNYSWAKDAIYSLTEKGILSGYGAGQFGPSNEITREEFAKVVVAAIFGNEAVANAPAGSFTDALSGWYAPYVGYGERAGIINGIGEGMFGVGRSITRQDIMVMLYRAMLLKGYVANTTEAYITDANDIADYALEAVNALKNAGIVSGYEDGSIKPTNNATRAEVAIMVDKFLKLF